MNKSDFWYSDYRHFSLPYVLHRVKDIPPWYSSKYQTKYTYIILNRDYNLISCPRKRGSSTISRRDASELVGSVVSFVRNPENFKNVWESRTSLYLYTSGKGYDNKYVESYLKRLTKLFSHKHTFLDELDIQCLKDSLDEENGDYLHLACDSWPNCDMIPELCSYNGHTSQMIGHKD